MEKFTDDSLMPFGKHKGVKLANVPAQHLLWLYENDRAGRLKSYIEEHMDVLKMEVKK